LLSALKTWQESRPQVELVWQDIGGGTGQIAKYVAARFESNPQGTGIDLLFGGGTDIYLRFGKQGLLQRVEMPAGILAPRIPPQLGGIDLYDPEVDAAQPGCRWYGPMLTSFGILCNREVLRRIDQPEPKEWADLGRPGLFGWVSAGDPRLTGSVHMVYEIILQRHGWEKGFRLLLQLGANTHTFIRDSGTLTRTVVNGEVAAAGNLDANGLTAVARDPQLMDFVLPAGETIINPDAIAVFKGAPHTALARAFVEFTLSDAGQQLFMLNPGQPGGPRRYPVCRLSVVQALYEDPRYPPEARAIGTVNPFELKTSFTYNSARGNSHWDALNDLFGATIIDAHEDLKAAWQAVLRLPEDKRAPWMHELFAPPCTEDELQLHARRSVEEGPRARTATVNRWGEEARARYRGIRRRASGEA
jgi:ABC-type Fe3+ transport system substrate-binding protein